MRNALKKKKAPIQPDENFTGGDESLHSDVQGSWTGNPLYGDEPVQDADDL